MFSYRKLLIFSFVVFAFWFASNDVHAACVLNNAHRSGPIRTGQPVNLLVSGTGCQGSTVSINIYKDMLGSTTDVHLKTASVLTFQTDTQAAGQTVITESEFRKGFTGSQTILAYFRANAGGSEVKSNSISLSGSGTGEDKSYACVAGDGKYACSPDGTLVGCQSLAACKTGAKSACGQIEKSLCGKSPSAGKTLSFTLDIPNPLESDSIGEFITKLTDALFALAIPAAVFIIIWAGVRFVLSRGSQTEIAAARKMLWYAIIGLAIILIGSGFISLIESILNLGGSSPPTEQTP